MSLRSFTCSLSGEEELDPMADLANRCPVNIPGRYYVDDQCIDCDLCRQTAPKNFKRNEEGGHSYVFQQPQTAEEEAQCEEAMQGCPVEAIGNDGDLALKLEAERALVE
jgi:ferredoxin